jgi:hypothetical protein
VILEFFFGGNNGVAIQEFSPSDVMSGIGIGNDAIHIKNYGKVRHNKMENAK